MSTISASTTSTTAYKVTADTTGTLVLQTGSTPTTAMTLGTDQSVTFAQAANLPNTFGFKNRIINGAMMIDQRNAGALVAGATGNIYGVDRTAVGVFGFGTGRISAQQSSTAPTGFTNSLVGTVTTADASPSTYYGYCMVQRIEGYNVADLGFGASGAATVTVSFWVRSSITGSYVLTLQNENADRAYSATYTINSANTWEYKTITVSGDTTGTWYKTTNAGLILYFGLGGGSGRQAPSLNAWNTGVAGGYAITDASGCVDWIATNGATFYITGVQLEKGSTATSFDFRPYATELTLCQRYYWKFTSSTDYRTTVIRSNGGSTQSGPMSYPVVMRATPTASIVTQPPSIKLIRALDDTTGTSYTTLGVTPLTTTDYLYTANASLSTASQILAFSFVSDFSAEL